MITTLIFQRKLLPLLPVMLVFLWGCEGPLATSPCDDEDVIVKSCFCGDASLVPLGPRTFPDLQLADHNWIAAVARVNGYNQIYLIDYDDPTIYRRITNDEEHYEHPTFSPDRSFLIFIGGGGFVHDPYLWRYDVAEDTTTNLPIEDIVMPYAFGNEPIVITPAGSRVYYRLSGANPPYYYEFATQTEGSLSNQDLSYVDGYLTGDTLIVFGGIRIENTGQPRGFYLVNTTAEYLCFINNPHLELVNRNGVNLHAAYSREWNAELGLVVFAEIDSTVQGTMIAVTNLDGSFYTTYTAGDYWDDHPTWGPDGKYILFDRANLMHLDLETGAVREFVKPEVIDGATSISQPDY